MYMCVHVSVVYIYSYFTTVYLCVKYRHAL